YPPPPPYPVAPQHVAPPPYAVPQQYAAAPQQYAAPAHHSPAPLNHGAPPSGHPTAGGIDPELLKTTKREPGPRATGPVVGAVLCLAGHVNRPEARACRACRGP